MKRRMQTGGEKNGRENENEMKKKLQLSQLLTMFF